MRPTTALHLLAGMSLLIPASPLVARQQGSIASFGTTVFSSAGLIGRIYFIPEGSRALPRFDELQPIGVTYTPSLNVPPQHWLTGFPGVTDRFEWFAIDYRGNFWIEKAGMYRFALESDDGAELYVDDQQIIDNNGQHPPETRFASLELNQGFHKLHVPYFQGPRDTVALTLQIAGPGEKLRVFTTDEFKAPANPDDWNQASSREETSVVAPQSTPSIDPIPKFRSTVLIAGGLTARVYRIPRRTSRLPEFAPGTPVDTFYSTALSLPAQTRRVMGIKPEFRS